MLLNAETLQGIAAGRITCQFRRWKRPTVKSGGTLNTAVGQLAILAVEVVDPRHITGVEARAAGWSSVEVLREALDRRSQGATTHVYRIDLHLSGPDPRIALRSELPDDEALDKVLRRLDRWDDASPVGPWTRAVLRIIAERPQVRAGDLAEACGLDPVRFKTNVRKLKGLGLTESLKIGYRISPRGRAVLDGES